MEEEGNTTGDALSAADALLGLAVVLRNFSQALVDRGLLDEDDVKEITLSSLRDCVDTVGSENMNLNLVDFVWSVLDRTLVMRPSLGPVDDPQFRRRKAPDLHVVPSRNSEPGS